MFNFNKMFIHDIVHYMCEYRVWTKSDMELVDMFLLPNHGVAYENYR